MELECLEGFSFKQNLENMGKIFTEKEMRRKEFQVEREGKLK